jgi:uroporphyrinogen-III synthase
LKTVLKVLRDKIVVAIGPPTKTELREYEIEALTPQEWTFDGVARLLKSIKTEMA